MWFITDLYDLNVFDVSVSVSAVIDFDFTG
jgi:hypothetical protein